MASSDTETALLVEVPAAEPHVAQYRSELDSNAALGIPAHVTVLAPFAPAGRLDGSMLATLERLFAAIRSFDVHVDRTSWFGTSVLWLAPRDPRPFRNLTDRVFEAFPQFPPFEGRHENVVPHLTVGHGRPLPELQRAEEAIEPTLPISALVSAVSLMTELTSGGRWVRSAVFPLA